MRYGRLLALAGTLWAAAILAPMQAAGAMPIATEFDGTGPVAHPIPSISIAADDRCPSGSASVADRLPVLHGRLAQGVARYGRDVPAAASDLAWYDSGGPFGGGVPVRAVGQFLREALAMGLSSGEIAGFLDPGFLRGIDDPNGGGGLLAFIAEQGDPVLLRELAAFAGYGPLNRPKSDGSAAGPVPCLPVARGRVPGSGGGPAPRRGRCRHDGRSGGGWVPTSAAHCRSDPGRGQPSAGRSTGSGIGGRWCSSRRLRLPRDALRGAALGERQGRRGEPSGVLGLGGADRVVGRERVER